MGQRLVINVIGKDDEIMANAYYHWDAYTIPAAQQLKKISNFIKENKLDGNTDFKDYAVEMLKSTGASLYEDYKNEKVDKEKLNRVAGMIQVSEAEIDNANSWAEGIITINLENESVGFGVFTMMDEEEFNEYSEEVGSVNEISGDFIDCSFADLECFVENLISIERGDYFIYDDSYFIPIYG